MSDLTPNTSTVRPFSSEEPAVTVPVFRPPVSPEDQTIFFPNAEGTPPPEPPVRIPHLGHAALFLAIAGFFLLAIQLILLGVNHAPTVSGKAAAAGMFTKFFFSSEALSYLSTLAVSLFIFPLFLKPSFT